MTIWGTSYFVSSPAADKYYAALGFSPRDVDAKARRGEIHIGIVPKVKAGETAYVNESEGRYFIRSDTPSRS